MKEIGELCRKNKVFFHTDAAQGIGKVPVNVNEMNIDLMSISAHKLYGPKGIGAIYIRRRPRVRLEAQMSGGGQVGGVSFFRKTCSLPPMLHGWRLQDILRLCICNMSLDFSSSDVPHNCMLTSPSSYLKGRLTVIWPISDGPNLSHHVSLALLTDIGWFLSWLLYCSFPNSNWHALQRPCEGNDTGPAVANLPLGFVYAEKQRISCKSDVKT